jgi:RNA-directed DNA polymerase
MDHQLYWKLTKWAKWQNPRKSCAWRKQRYWPRKHNRFDFSDGKATLAKYADTPIKRHVKVQGSKTPFDGDWAYWIGRLGRDPSKPKRVVTLLKRQEGCCMLCGLHFMSEDYIEVHHRNGNHNDNMPANLVLLHGHCHDEVHRTKCSHLHPPQVRCDKSLFSEEPDEVKVSCPVREWQRGDQLPRRP